MNALENQKYIYGIEDCYKYADYLINKHNEENNLIPLTNKRIQKLLFASLVFFAVLKKNKHERLFEDKFVTFSSGPVIKSIFEKYRIFLNGYMFALSFDYKKLSNEQTQVLDIVYEKTKNLDTITLIKNASKKNNPWDQVYKEYELEVKEIPYEQIYDYYVDKLKWVELFEENKEGLKKYFK